MTRLEFSCTEPVRTTTLQTWSHVSGLSAVDVLKLDIEGHELDALQGAGPLLKGTRVIQFEFSPCNIDTGTYFRDFGIFHGGGFPYHRLGPSGLCAVDRYGVRDEVFVMTNYFVTRQRS